MERFIEPPVLEGDDLPFYLKSSMERFIGRPEQKVTENHLDLKSSMERFIDFQILRHREGRRI